MRPTEEMKVTNNPSLYSKLRKIYLYNTGKINCLYCKYHRGENRKRASKDIMNISQKLGIKIYGKM